MPDRRSVQDLVTGNHTYEEAALRLGIPPGKAYLVATGTAVDSTDGLSPEDLERPGLLTSAQHLSNPRTEQPDREAHVREFLAARAKNDEQMQAVAKS